jgi:hypothetical protein
MGSLRTPRQKAAVEKMLKDKKGTLFPGDVEKVLEEEGDYDLYEDSGKPLSSTSSKGSRMSAAEAAGREVGTKEYNRIKRVQDAASQPIRALRKATDYIGEKYGDLRDSTRSALSGDPEGAEFRRGQRAIRERMLGYKKGGKVKAKGGAVKSSASKRADGCAVRGKTKGRMV